MQPRRTNRILGTIARIAVGLFAAVLGLMMMNNMQARDRVSETQAGQAWSNLSEKLQDEACDVARIGGVDKAVDHLDTPALGVDRDEMMQVVEVMCGE